jgi:putative DNA primase/helicase
MTQALRILPPPATDLEDLTANLPSDVGNAARLVDLHGDRLRYVKGWGWLVYDGKRWKQDDTGQVVELAKDAVRSFRQEAVDEPDRARAEALWKHAYNSERGERLEQMVKLARSIPGVAVTLERFDANPLLLNFANGTLDLESGTLRPHSPDDHMTHLCPYNYVRNARSDRWDSFIAWLACYDRQLMDWLQVAAGYSLTGLVGEKSFNLCYGPGGDNGKTTFLEALYSALGDYADVLEPESLMAGRTNTINNDIAKLVGKRYVISSEPETGKKLSMSLIKKITGGDTMSACFKYKEPFNFQPQLKLWLAVNERPDMNETGRAALGRVRVVPFKNEIKEQDKDKQLKDTLKQPEHAEAILAWAVMGWHLYSVPDNAGHPRGLPYVEQIESASKDYSGEQAPFKQFLDDCFLETDNEADTVETKVVLAAYDTWQRGEDEAPALTLHSLKKEAEKHGHTRGKSNGKTILRKLKLKPENPAPTIVAVQPVTF